MASNAFSGKLKTVTNDRKVESEKGAFGDDILNCSPLVVPGVKKAVATSARLYQTSALARGQRDTCMS